MIEIQKIPIWKRVMVALVYMVVVMLGLRYVEKIVNPYNFNYYWFTRIYGPPPVKMETHPSEIKIPKRAFQE